MSFIYQGTASRYVCWLQSSTGRTSFGEAPAHKTIGWLQSSTGRMSCGEVSIPQKIPHVIHELCSYWSDCLSSVQTHLLAFLDGMSQLASHVIHIVSSRPKKIVELLMWCYLVDCVHVCLICRIIPFC
ncbi:hypothetical protein NP493_1841g00001 [Ridgeia piscesae]|uniref:Uncharacterized protein n=1 Tax=Ridgeia piscesae TaxID=27915 RepID=A0AAD9JRJ9_RIDPI|nr:hypothetical protein NP493_1841g00001 [Ridgeia piscesae]